MIHKLILKDTNNNIILTKNFQNRAKLENFVISNYDLYDHMIEKYYELNKNKNVNIITQHNIIVKL